MIRHIEIFSAKAGMNENAVLEGLAILKKVPHPSTLEVSLNRKSDQLGNDVDVVVYGEFKDEAALAAYKDHELYQEAIRLVQPLREMRIAADIDA